MNRFAPNRERLSRCAAAEMRFFDDISARTRLLWSVLTLTGVSLLFCAVYYLNENRAAAHLNTVWAVGGLFAAYVALCFVRRRTSDRGASSFLTAMLFTFLSLLVTVTVSYLLFRTAWYWEFQGFIPGGAVRLMRGVLSCCFWAPLAVLVLHIALWFVPVGDAPIRGTRVYFVTTWLPIAPPILIFSLTFFRDAVAQSKAARAVTVLYLSLCFALMMHYVMKAAAYLLLVRSAPQAEEREPAKMPEWACALMARLQTLLAETRDALAAKLHPAEEAVEVTKEAPAEETPAEEISEAPAEETPAPEEAPAEDAPQPKPKKPRKKKTAPKTEAETPAEESPAPEEAPAEEVPQPKPKKPRKKKTAPKTEAKTPAEGEPKPE